MKGKNRLDLLYRAVTQLDIIVALFLWLFAIAPYSFYSPRWDDTVNSIVRNCNIFNIIAFTLLMAVTVFCAVRLRKIKKPGAAFIISIAIFALHILIRYNMLGSYQYSDGSLYFMAIERFAYSPNGILTDPVSSGFIFGHMAQGFIFVTMLGQLLNVPSGMGFQYSYMVMGAVAAVCLFNIFRKVFPKKKLVFAAIAAFIVSVQPMFLGLSTMIQMEYPLTILFIYALCAYLTGRHILMVFWLLMLGTCKETGTMMAFCFLFFVVVYELAAYIKRCGGIKASIKKIKKWQLVLFAAFIAVCIGVFIKVLFVPVWGGVRIIDVLRIGGDSNLSFRFEKGHFLMKMRQLYILNFSWLWAMLAAVSLIICLAVPSIRKKSCINMRAFSFVLVQYLVYTFFLLFFIEAKQTRYNMLSDVLFLFISMTLFINVADKLAVYIPTALAVTGLAVTETFLTIDPLSLAVFTNVSTGRQPMVWTVTTKSEKSSVDINIGDFGYYNYQYAFMDRAVDRMLERTDYQGWYRIISSFEQGVEDQFVNEALVWDSKLKRRTYITTDEPDRYHRIQRMYYTSELQQWDLDDRCIYVEIPWCRSDSEKAIEALSEYYVFEGPFESAVGQACSLSYYIMYLK